MPASPFSFSRLASAAIALLLSLQAVLIFGTWMAAALGLPVESLLSDEALRWFFRQSLRTFVSWRVEGLVLVIVALGAAGEGGLLSSPRRHPHAWLSSLLVLAVCIILLALGLFGADAPLLSASGRLLPSPFLPGLAWSIAAAVVLASAVCGLLSRRLRTWTEVFALCYVGLQRYAPWLVVWLLAELLYKTLRYVL